MHAPRPIIPLFNVTPLLSASAIDYMVSRSALSHPHTVCSLQCPQSIERLRSPIHIADSCRTPPPAVSYQTRHIRVKGSILTRLCTQTCIPSSRRRTRTANQSSRRRRLAPRDNSHISAPTHAFDDLPWISTLESAPDFVNPWDIADLSLIPDAESSPSGPGPVRRRKTSLRSNPMNTPPSPSGSPLPTRDTSLLLPPSVPTPRSHFIPSRVLFHNLMPVSCDTRTEQLHPCINSSRLTF